MENNDTHMLVLVCYLLLVLSQTILTFVANKGKPKQGRKTLMTLLIVSFPMFFFLFSLMKLYVYFYNPKADQDE